MAAKDGKAGETRNLKNPTPSPDTRVPPPARRAAEGPTTRPGRGAPACPDPQPPGFQRPTSPRPAAQDSQGWAGRVSTPPARSPSHLHLPGLAAAIMPPTSPDGATPRGGGGGRTRTSLAAARSPPWPWSVDGLRTQAVRPCHSLRVSGSVGSAPGEASQAG